jgi:hypothetical protein
MQPPEYTVSAYEARDRDLLFDFRRYHYEGDSLRTDPAYLDWLFLDEFQSKLDRPALFVCKDQQRIVGTQGLQHVRLKTGADSVAAAWVADFAVRKELQRGSGIGSAIARTSRASVKIRMAMDVTEAAAGLALRDGWQLVCELPLWVRPLRAVQLIRSRMPRMPTRGIAAMAQAALDLLLKRGLRAAHAGNRSLTAMSAFDQRADAIWSAVMPNFSVICQRDRKYLQWRFDRFPANGVYQRFWLQVDDRPEGYVVLRVGEHQGMRSGFIIDYLCPPHATAALMSLALQVCESQGAVVAYCPGLNVKAEPSFRKLGFFKRTSGWRYLVYTKESPPESARLMSDSANWFITAADSNLDHMRALQQFSSGSQT